MPQMPQDDVGRILHLLETAVRISGRSRSQLERDVGFGKSYLTQLLGGRIELKVRVLLAILKEVGIDPLIFFQIAFSPRTEQETGGTPRSQVEAMLESADRLGYPSPAPSPKPPLPDEDELERIVRKAVQEALGEERRDEKSQQSRREGARRRARPAARSRR
ncbi:MAG: hypothetical protein ACRDH5_19205 [bacterium]